MTKQTILELVEDGDLRCEREIVGSRVVYVHVPCTFNEDDAAVGCDRQLHWVEERVGERLLAPHGLYGGACVAWEDSCRPENSSRDMVEEGWV